MLGGEVGVFGGEASPLPLPLDRTLLLHKCLLKFNELMFSDDGSHVIFGLEPRYPSEHNLWNTCTNTQVEVSMTADAERCESYRGMSWLSCRYVCSHSNILSQLIESSGSPVHLTVTVQVYHYYKVHSVIILKYYLQPVL